MNDDRYRNRWFVIAILGACCAGSVSALAQSSPTGGQSTSVACPDNDTGLKLPTGFCASIFADGIGHARHLVVAENGMVYVNTWSGRYYGNDTPHAGGFLVALQDTNGAGRADVILRFGETTEKTVRRTSSRLGEDDCRLPSNSCEHFCSWCLTGVSHSPQVQQ